MENAGKVVKRGEFYVALETLTKNIERRFKDCLKSFETTDQNFVQVERHLRIIAGEIISLREEFEAFKEKHHGT